MRKYLILSVAALGLVACGGGSGKTVKQLESGCAKMAEVAGEEAPKGACACMAKTLVAELSAEDAQTMADALGKIDSPEDMMMAMMPLMGNEDIMKAMDTVGTKCDME